MKLIANPKLSSLSIIDTTLANDNRPDHYRDRDGLRWTAAVAAALFAASLIMAALQGAFQ